jgi:hypothetical protein
MEKLVIINIKPSQRVMASFRRTFPEAQYGGSASLGSKSKCYYLPVDVYERNKEVIKKFGSKSKHQPFL